jgi:hypothetical protein
VPSVEENPIIVDPHLEEKEGNGLNNGEWSSHSCPDL